LPLLNEENKNLINKYNKNYTITYTGNEYVNSNSIFGGTHYEWVIKTNRYSHLGLLYEYDKISNTPNVDDVNDIIKTFFRNYN
jgi:hypothetical protein